MYLSFLRFGHENFVGRQYPLSGARERGVGWVGLVGKASGGTGKEKYRESRATSREKCTMESILLLTIENESGIMGVSKGWKSY